MTTSRADYLASLPRKRVGSGVLFSDSSGRILLVEPTYKDYWELPGGVVEANESPYAAAVREIDEELGLSVLPGRLLVVDWVPPRPDRTEGLMFVYDGGLLDARQTADIRLAEDELRSWAWCTATEAARRLSPLLARRAAAAVAARTDTKQPGGQTMFYLEDGSALD